MQRKYDEETLAKPGVSGGATTRTVQRETGQRTFGRHVSLDGDRYVIRSFDGRCYLYRRQYLGVPRIARSKFKDTYIGRIAEGALNADRFEAVALVRAVLEDRKR